MKIPILSKYINKKKITPILPTSKNELDINTENNTNTKIKTRLPNTFDEFTVHAKPTFSDQQIKLMEEGKLNKISTLKQCVTYP